ncbi:hypothetical protein C0431_10305 [bacterium]|nr:hypothetical protein [bacterium]
MKQIPNIAIAALLALTVIAQADEKSDLKRANQYVTRTESAITKGNGILDKSQASNGQIIDSAKQSATKQLEEAKELLAKAKEWFDKVPDSFADKAAGLQSYKSAEEKLSALEQRLNGAADKIEKDNELLNQGSKNDASTIEALIDKLEKLKALMGSDGISRKYVDEWAQIDKDTKAMIAKYGNAKGSRGGNGDQGQRDFAIKVIDIKNKYDILIADVNGEYVKNEPGRIKANIQTIEEYIQKAVDQKNFGFFLDVIPRLSTILDAKGHCYETFLKDNPQFDASIVPSIKATLKNIEETAKKLENEIIQSNVPFKDIYTGGDKESLKSSIRANFLKKVPNAKILRIDIITSQWTRSVEWEYNSYQTSWSKTDQSTMQAIIYVQGKDPNHVYMLGCPLFKDNLSGGTVSLIVPGSDEKPANPAFILLKSKFN